MCRVRWPIILRSRKLIPRRKTKIKKNAQHGFGVSFRWRISQRRSKRIEIYRKLAQATEKSGLERLGGGNARTGFGQLPAGDGTVVAGRRKSEFSPAKKGITVIEVKEDKLMLTRNNDFIMLGREIFRA